MAELTIKCEIIYKKTDCDLSVCHACNDMIFTQNNTMFMSVNGKPQSLNINLCDSCYDAVKK